ncbi:MAG: DUF192 domain-containing protein [Acidimicrobiia bacterium]
MLASLEVPLRARGRMRGLRGRDDFEGALMLRHCRQVHTFGMRFPVDVAFCDRSGLVLRVDTLPVRRVSRPVWSATFVVEARAGAFERWKLLPGDQLEVRE